MIDIDGVVADVRHRLHHLRGRRKDWDAFFAAAVDDGVHAEGVAVVARLAEDHDVVFLTGRPERLRAETEAWLAANDLGGQLLLMRREGDRRPAAMVKVGHLRRLAAERRIAIVVDDDDDVATAVRAAGHAVFVADWERRAAIDEAELHEAQEVEGRT